MMKSLFYPAIVILSVAFPLTTTAGPIQLSDCNESAVSLNSVTVTSDSSSAELLQYGTYSASSCLFFNRSNDNKRGLSSPEVNVGLNGDGLLNGEGGLLDAGGLWFIEEGDLQDLGSLSPLEVGATGENDDPGWIHLAHYSNGKYSKVDDDERLNYSDVNVPGFAGFEASADNPFSIDHLFDITLECTAPEGRRARRPQCQTMTWELRTEPNIIEMVESLLGPSQFDHLAFSIKAGNGFIVYDFDFTEIFGNERLNGNDSLDFSTAYTLSGTLSTADFLNRKDKMRNVSHINIWARDPVGATSVSEPGTLMLLSLSLLALIGFRRRTS